MTHQTDIWIQYRYKITEKSHVPGKSRKTFISKCMRTQICTMQLWCWHKSGPSWCCVHLGGILGYHWNYRCASRCLARMLLWVGGWVDVCVCVCCAMEHLQFPMLIEWTVPSFVCERLPTVNIKLTLVPASVCMYSTVLLFLFAREHPRTCATPIKQRDLSKWLGLSSCQLSLKY